MILCASSETIVSNIVLGGGTFCSVSLACGMCFLLEECFSCLWNVSIACYNVSIACGITPSLVGWFHCVLNVSSTCGTLILFAEGLYCLWNASIACRRFVLLIVWCFYGLWKASLACDCFYCLWNLSLVKCFDCLCCARTASFLKHVGVGREGPGGANRTHD